MFILLACVYEMYIGKLSIGFSFGYNKKVRSLNTFLATLLKFALYTPITVSGFLMFLCLQLLNILWIILERFILDIPTGKT